MTEERAPGRRKDQQEFAEEQASLLKITLGPLIWALHFVSCYGLAAVACANGWDIGAVRAGLLVFSCAALAGIAWTGRAAWRQWNAGETGDGADRGGWAGDRRQFLGHAAFLLSVISFIGTVFVSLPLVLIGGCQ